MFILAAGTLVLSFYDFPIFYLFVRPRRLFCLLSRCAEDVDSWFFMFSFGFIGFVFSIASASRSFLYLKTMNA